MSKKFTAVIEQIGINPFVFVPDELMQQLIDQAGQHKGKIPVIMQINKIPFPQTLVKYAGHWRLYVNGPMLKTTGTKVGDTASFVLKFDKSDRSIDIHPKLLKAFKKTPAAKEVFDKLTPSLRFEVVKYIAKLKTEESVERNVERAVLFLLGKGSFIGREQVEVKKK